MAGLQATTGLISGIDIAGVVDQLIAIDSVPRDNLQARQEKLQQQQAALVQLTQMFNTTTYMMKNLAKASVYTSRTVHSSNESVIKATKSGSPAPGNYTFTSVQMAQAQTTVTDGIADDSAALGKTGDIKISFGRDLTSDYSLTSINGGSGFDRGYIRITDASGTRANIDLRTAQSMNDVLDAINDCMDIDVYASLEGDSIVLSDYSGGTGALKVQDVNGGSTAQSLGLANVAVDENGVIRGKSLFYLGSETDISLLNDGNGIAFDGILPDLQVTLADGTKFDVDFNAIQNPLTEEQIEAGMKLQDNSIKTVGDLLNAFNSAGKVTVNGVETQKFLVGISADGKRLEMRDLTTGSGEFSVSQMSYTGATEQPILYQLGLADYGVSSVKGTDGAITGRAVIGDLDSVLLSSLNGGRGYPESAVYGDITGNAIIAVQDKAGNMSFLTVSRAEFKAAETLEDMIRLLNGKMKDTFLYDPETLKPLVTEDEDGNPIYQYYDEAETLLKYKTDSDGSIPPVTEMAMQLGSTEADFAYEWVYDDAGDIVGYKVEDKQASSLDLTPYQSVTLGEYPQLDSEGKLAVFDVLDTVEYDPGSLDPAGYGTTADGHTITEFVTQEVNGKEYFVGYAYKDENNATQTYAFTEDELKLLKQEFADGTAPKIVDGEFVKADPPMSGLLTGPDPFKDYTFEDDGFTIEWLTEGVVDEDGNPVYNVDGDEDSGQKQKVIGYKKTGMTPHELTEEEKTAVNANKDAIEAGTFFAVFDEETRLLKFSDTPIGSATDPKLGADAEKYADLTWDYDETDPDNPVLKGYYIHKDTEYESYVELDPMFVAQKGYPLLQMEPATEVVSGSIGLELQLSADGRSIEVVDSSGGSGAITFADFSSQNGKIASMLGLNVVDKYVNSAKGDDLNLQTYSHNTEISSLNGGAGVDTAGLSFKITDSTGYSYPFLFDYEKPTSIGDIINTINTHAVTDPESSAVNVLRVYARINSTGDGIEFYEFGGGTGKFSVVDLSSADNSEAKLKQLGIGLGSESPVIDEEGNARGLRITGSTTYTISVGENDSLEDIRQKVNDLNAGFTATTINDGSAKPYRLSITGNASGADGQMNVDFSGIGLGTTIMSKAQDAIVLYGDQDGTNSLVINSKSNTITGVIPGITLTLYGTSKDPINIYTENSSKEIKTSLTSFVENYNKFREFFNEVTIVDAIAGTKGILAQDPALIRLERDMSDLVLKMMYDMTGVRSLADLGITLDETTQDEDGNVLANTAGFLSFDESVFDLAYESNPDAIKEFFTRTKDALNSAGEIVQEANGYASLWTALGKTYADDSYSTLNSKYDSMQIQIDDNTERLAFLDERLEAKRQIYLNQFYRMESALAKMQGDLEYINKISNSSSSSGSTSA